MANMFLDPREIIEGENGNNQLNYIKYTNINEHNREFKRSDLWDFEFIMAPAAVYFPGNGLIKTRLISVSPSFSAQIGDIGTTIRGYKIKQKAGITSDCTVELTLMDREDQAITAFKRDWQEKIGCMDNKFSYRKEDTVCECKLIQFNTSRIPIAEWRMYNGQLSDGVLGGMTFGSEETPSNNGEVTLSLDFEHYDFKLLNLPS